MKLQSLQLLPWLSVLASHVSSTVVVQNATYDDLTAVPVLEAAVGTYKDLIYNAWVVGGPATVGGVASESQPNVALTSITETLTNGTASITIAAPDQSFAFLDFYFGCVLRTDEGTVGVATECTTTVAGYSATNEQVALAVLTFTPPVDPLTPVPMIHAVLEAEFLLPLHNVTFVQSNTLAALKVDNLHYEVST